MTKNFIALDFEMTGTDPNRDRIIKVDAVKFTDGSPVDSLWSLCNPGLMFDADTESLVGVRNSEVLASPAIDEVVKSLVAFVGLEPMVIHHVPFDLPFIENACRRAGAYLKSFTLIDTLRLCRQKNLNIPRLSLDEVAGHFGVSGATPAVTTGLIYLKLTES